MKSYAWAALFSMFGFTISMVLWMDGPVEPSNINVLFKTSSASYSIPRSLVIPGSVFDEPVQNNQGDKFGASIDLKVSKSYMASEGIEMSGDLNITVSRPTLADRDLLWLDSDKLDALTLSGYFTGGEYEFDAKLNLYKVFYRIEGDIDHRSWDLISEEPSSSRGRKSSARGAWVASCNTLNDSALVICNYEVDVLGFYMFITGAQTDYLVLEEITSYLERQFILWKI